MEKKKEIYTHEASWPIYGMSWSVRPDYKFRVAIGSFIEEYKNKVEIVQVCCRVPRIRSLVSSAPYLCLSGAARCCRSHTPDSLDEGSSSSFERYISCCRRQLDEESQKFLSRGSIDHPYPTTKIMWLPDKLGACASCHL